jgi:hypothetical protein
MYITGTPLLVHDSINLFTANTDCVLSVTGPLLALNLML